MRQIGEMQRVKRRVHVALARCMDAIEVAQPDGAPGLVEGRHRIQPVADAGDDRLGIALEGIGRLPRRPAAVAGQHQRQVPMVERREGLDAARLQAIDEPVVEIEALLVRSTRPLGNDARPGDGEAIGFHAERLDQVKVFVQPVVVIAGDIAVVAAIDSARHVGKRVPDRRLAAVQLRCPLDLERGGCHAEHEIAGETVGKGLGIDHGVSRDIGDLGSGATVTLQ